MTDGRGKRVEARIKTIDSNTLTAEIERDVSGAGELTVEISVALALIKPARFEFAVEKCTELGARRFIPVIANRCMVKPDRIKTTRLRQITREAAKQSGRSWIPEILQPIELEELDVPDSCRLLVANRTAEKDIEEALKPILASPELIVAVGPEGDFTGEELKQLINRGAILFSLGELTLRSETTAMAATAHTVAMVRKK